jgi:hypothetical protein
MGMDDESYNKAENEVSDLQSQMDPTRSECIRPVIMDHIHRYERAKSMTDKYMELEGLITFCIPYMDDRKLREELEHDMSEDEVNFSSDFIRNYKSEFVAGISWNVILENEYRRLLPKLRRIWFKVHKSLMRQDLIPWSLTYPEKMLESALMDELMTDLQSGPSAEQAIQIQAGERQMLTAGEPPPWVETKSLTQMNDVEFAEDYTEEAEDPTVATIVPILPPAEGVSDAIDAEESDGEVETDEEPDEELEEAAKEDEPKLADEDVDENYMATDKELEEAAEIFKTKLRKRKDAKTSI